MGALNGSTHFQPTTPEAIRARTIAGLFDPVRDIVMAADRLHSVVVARDFDSVVQADRNLQARIDAYLRRLNGED